MNLSNFKILTILLVILSGMNHVKSQDLGANFNEAIAGIDTSLVAKSKVKWVRGFVNIPAKLLNINNEGVLSGVNQTAINNYTDHINFLNAKKVITDGEAVKLIFSLKTNFKHLNVGVPLIGSEEMSYWLNAIEQLLVNKGIGNSIDILVLGNEPMWETENEDASTYGLFLNYLANVAADWKTKYNWTFDIYSGALNRAKELSSNPILNQVINVTIRNNNIVGIDLHPHCKTIDQTEDDLSFVRSKIAYKKDVILTEFSLNRMFVDHGNDPIGGWGVQYGYKPELLMYQWLNILMIDAAAGRPHSSDEVISFFNTRSWYPKNWFTTFYDAFKKYKVKAATYRLQDEMINPPKLLNSESAMWLLNALYNGKLLGVDDNGVWNTNPLCFPDYDQIVGITTNNMNVEYTFNINFYPNPVNDILTIEFENHINYPICISILDIQGKTLYNKTKFISPDRVNIKELDLANGLYFVKCTGKDFSTIRKIQVAN